MSYEVDEYGNPINDSNPKPVKLTGSIVKDDTLQNAAAATGVGTSLDVTGKSMVCFQVKGTFVGTITFEASNDGGTTWDSLKVFRINGDAGATTATAPGIFQTSVAALKSVRANITAYTSGSITVLGTASVVG